MNDKSRDDEVVSYGFGPNMVLRPVTRKDSRRYELKATIVMIVIFAVAGLVALFYTVIIRI